MVFTANFFGSKGYEKFLNLLFPKGDHHLRNLVIGNVTIRNARICKPINF